MIGRSFYVLEGDAACKVFVLDEVDGLYLIAQCKAYGGVRDFTHNHLAGSMRWVSPCELDAWLAYDQDRVKRLGKLQAKAHNLITEIETCYSAPLGASLGTF